MVMLSIIYLKYLDRDTIICKCMWVSFNLHTRDS